MAKTFDFIGFEPEPALVDFAKARFGRIHNEAPSDSFAFATIRKTLEGGFKAALKINSSVGTFVAESISEDPQRAIAELCARIRSQLRLWKRDRFNT